VLLATDCVSVDADHDKETVALYGAPRLRGCDGGTAYRVGGARPARRRSDLLPPSSRPTQVGATPILMFRAVLGSGGATTVRLIA
jgi:hypothetical protein